MSKLTKRITAMLLAGMLVIGSAPGSVFAASTDVDPSQTSEIAEEVYEEEISEAPAGEGETYEITEETSEASAAVGETAQAEVGSEATADAEESPSEATFAEEAQYYTVTLDANGGYFENEWDDTIGDYAQQAEVVEKHIPVNGTVASFPVFTDQDGQTMLFAGWSLERDGELVSEGDEEYAPVESCTLYAVWQIADASFGEAEGQGIVDEGTDQADTTQDSEKVDAAVGSESEDEVTTKEGNVEEDSGDVVGAEEGNIDEDTTSEVNADSETENEQSIIADQEVVFLDEVVKKTSTEPSDSTVIEEETQPGLFESSTEEETVSEDAAKGITKSGTCGDNLTWTLDQDGTLTIRGTGNMSDFNYDDENPWYSYTSSILKIIIKEGVTSIGNSAFNGCDNLKSITMPNSISRIGNVSFYCCRELTSITIPDGVTSIGGEAFSNCSKLKSITFPNNLTNIEGFAFYNCKGLTSIKIPDNVKTIGVGAFAHCHRLKTVTIPNSVTSIEYSTFEDCGRLISIVIPHSVKKIGDYAFAKCSNLKNVKIENGVKNIGGHAFYECTSLTSIVIPNSVTKIGKDAFCNCISLKNAVIPNGVKSIEDSTFYSCESLTNITIPDGLINIGEQAFASCESLPSITIPDSVTDIGNEAFIYCRSLKSFRIPQGVTSIEDRAFYYCGNMSYIVIQNDLAEIGKEAFKGCSGLADVYYIGSKSKWKSIDIYESNKELLKAAIHYNWKGIYEIGSATVTGLVTKTYTGKALTQSPKVKVGNDTLKANIDYTISYKSNTNAGTATITITGKGNYTGTTSANFKINKASQSITAKSTASSIAVGKAATVSITGAKGAKSYKSSNTAIATVNASTGKVIAKKVGTVKITATSAATANYNAASKNVTIKVVAASIAKAAVTCPSTKVFSGWALTPVPTVKFGSKTLKKGTDFSLSFKNNKNVGIATITITGKGNYTGTVKKTFIINPMPTTISEITLGTGKITVTWIKQPAQTTGYQIQYSSRNDFKMQKIVTVSGASKMYNTISGLAKKHQYYVRIRTYKTVGSKKYYSTWSVAKSVKTK